MAVRARSGRGLSCRMQFRTLLFFCDFRAGRVGRELWGVGVGAVGMPDHSRSPARRLVRKASRNKGAHALLD